MTKRITPAILIAMLVLITVGCRETKIALPISQRAMPKVSAQEGSFFQGPLGDLAGISSEEVGKALGQPITISVDGLEWGYQKGIFGQGEDLLLKFWRQPETESLYLAGLILDFGSSPVPLEQLVSQEILEKGPDTIFILVAKETGSDLGMFYLDFHFPPPDPKSRLTKYQKIRLLCQSKPEQIQKVFDARTGRLWQITHWRESQVRLYSQAWEDAVDTFVRQVHHRQSPEWWPANLKD